MKKFTAFIALLFMVLMVAAPAGAVTFTKLSEALMGNLRAVVWKVTLDSSYPSGGEDITKITTDSFSTVLSVTSDGAETVSGLIPAYDYTNGKLIMYVSSSAAGMQGVNPTTDLSGVSVRFLVIGW